MSADSHQQQSAAKRRRTRRLRSFARHEQMSLAMAAAYHGHHATQSGSGFQGATPTAYLHSLQAQIAGMTAVVTLLEAKVARLCSDAESRASASQAYHVGDAAVSTAVIVQNLQKGAYAPSNISQGQPEVGGSVQSGTSTVMLENSSEVRQGPTEESTRTIESSAEERIMEGNKCGHSGPTETCATSPGDEVSGRGGVFVDLLMPTAGQLRAQGKKVRTPAHPQ